MASGEVTMGNIRVGEFVRLSNAFNDAICAPLAERVAAKAKAAAPANHPEVPQFIHVKKNPRTGFASGRRWASSVVINGHPYAMKLEAKYGILGRAMR